MPLRDASITAWMNEPLCLGLRHLPVSLVGWGGHHQQQGVQNTTKKKCGSYKCATDWSVFFLWLVLKHMFCWFSGLFLFVCLMVGLVGWLMFFVGYFFFLSISYEHFYLYKNNNILGLYFKWTLANKIGQLYWPQQATPIYLGFAF